MFDDLFDEEPTDRVEAVPLHSSQRTSHPLDVLSVRVRCQDADFSVCVFVFALCSLQAAHRRRRRQHHDDHHRHCNHHHPVRYAVISFPDRVCMCVCRSSFTLLFYAALVYHRITKHTHTH